MSESELGSSRIGGFRRCRRWPSGWVTRAGGTRGGTPRARTAAGCFQELSTGCGRIGTVVTTLPRVASSCDGERWTGAGGDGVTGDSRAFSTPGFPVLRGRVAPVVCAESNTCLRLLGHVPGRPGQEACSVCNRRAPLISAPPTTAIPSHHPSHRVAPCDFAFPPEPPAPCSRWRGFVMPSRSAGPLSLHSKRHPDDRVTRWLTTPGAERS